MNGEKLLFNESDLHILLEKTKSEIKKDIKKYTTLNVSSREKEIIARELVQKYNLQVPVLFENEIYEIPPKELQKPMRFSNDPNRATGLTFRFQIPFAGDCRFFKFKPSRFKNYSTKGCYTVSHLEFEFTLREDQPVDEVYRLFEAKLEKIRQPLFYMAMVIDDFKVKVLDMIHEENRDRESDKMEVA